MQARCCAQVSEPSPERVPEPEDACSPTANVLRDTVNSPKPAAAPMQQEDPLLSIGGVNIPVIASKENRMQARFDHGWACTCGDTYFPREMCRMHR
jgi:hypothetical protein